MSTVNKVGSQKPPLDLFDHPITRAIMTYQKCSARNALVREVVEILAADLEERRALGITTSMGMPLEDAYAALQCNKDIRREYNEVKAALGRLGCKLDSAHWIADALRETVRDNCDSVEIERTEGVSRELADMLKKASRAAFSLSDGIVHEWLSEEKEPY